MPTRLEIDDCLPVLELLTLRTRVATFEQLQAFAELYPRSQGSVEVVVSILLREQLLASQWATLRLTPLHDPLFVWNVDEIPPEFSTLANHLSARVHDAPVIRHQLFWATRKAESFTGGLSGINRQPLQVQHDLGTTAVFLRGTANQAFSGCDWFSEDILRRDFAWFSPSKRPDAAVFDSESRPTCIIEIGGIYSSDDLRRMHRFYSRERIRYELW